MSSPRLASLLSAVAVVAGSLLIAPVAEAASYTSTGVRCTKVGTQRANHIVGTPRRDVICGRGGNDVIDGRGGNDIIDGGPGNDTLRGSVGNDRLLGGDGNDAMLGEDGTDALYGSGGNDRVDAGPGNDALSGGDGNDFLQGGAGADRAVGGAGNDTAHGSTGDDTLSGDAGDDELLGEGGNDVLVGGAGTNWCDATSTDRQSACKTDLEAPQAGELRLSQTTVDVTNGPVTVTASLHVTDDTGLRSVQLGQMARLTSGTVRNGWWTTTVTVPQYALPGTRDLNAFLTDRVGRPGWQGFPEALTVVDLRPDLAAPVVRSMSVDPASVDVRAAARTVTATVRISDDRAGAETVYLCAAHLFADAYRQAAACENLQRTSGTALDGVWRGSYTVPRGAVSGDWNFQVWIDDASGNHPTQYYTGPDQVAWESANLAEPWGIPLPGGAGRFRVTGSSDINAPVLRTVTLDPPTLDVTTTSKTVHLDIAVTDVEGVTGVGADVSAGDFPDHVDLGSSSDAVLISGTPKDGVWRLSIPVAQGTPPGSYELQLWVEDLTHWVSWFSPGSSHAQPGTNVLTPAQTPVGSVITVQ
jgi:Ca2+-binding RTX toxin-like protein